MIVRLYFFFYLLRMIYFDMTGSPYGADRLIYTELSDNSEGHMYRPINRKLQEETRNQEKEVTNSLRKDKFA